MYLKAAIGAHMPIHVELGYHPCRNGTRSWLHLLKELKAEVGSLPEGGACRTVNTAAPKENQAPEARFCAGLANELVQTTLNSLLAHWVLTTEGYMVRAVTQA